MNLTLGSHVNLSYKSRSQLARVLSETWIENEMYCPSCPSEYLEPLPQGTRVFDFQCDNCEEKYQVKSTSRPVGNRILDSEYNTMMAAIRNDSSPNLIVLHYSMEHWIVQDLLLIPRHMIVPSVIEKRKSLTSTARRAGWTGCNFLLTNIPSTGKIYAIVNSEVRPPELVRKEWARYRFIRDLNFDKRGWLVDIMRCVQSFDRKRFTLKEFYADFESELSKLHPQNRNIRAKIRQQLQILRDKGHLRFIGRGIYESL